MATAEDARSAPLENGKEFLRNGSLIYFIGPEKVVLDLDNMLKSMRPPMTDTEIYDNFPNIIRHFPANDINTTLTPFQKHSLKYGLTNQASQVYTTLATPSHGKK
eukprot:GHVT01089392.1.p1 GENE.GHVT01089392.1~~GHVT01089392.1.p1  ORF type:complete len:105 (+),score=3.06 GHVT01089392.1:847-1161(+)